MRLDRSTDTQEEGPRHRRLRWQRTLLWLVMFVHLAMADVSIVLFYRRTLKVIRWCRVVPGAGR